MRYVYPFSDDRILPSLYLDEISYFMGSSTSVKSEFVVSEPVQKSFVNSDGSVSNSSFLLEKPYYIGMPLNDLSQTTFNYRTIDKTCFLSPDDYIDFVKTDFLQEPSILDFFSQEELEYLSSLPTYDEERGVSVT